MYEGQTFEVILQRMLDRVPNTYDKREGSLIYNALAPAAAELAQMYIELIINNNLSFVDAASGEYLTRKTREFGVNRQEATKAVRQGEFYDSDDNPFDIPLESRFSIGDLNYKAISRISAGVYQMECEQAGTIGNQLSGNLLPIENINGLSRAVLTDVLIPGEDTETDESLRQRFFEEMNEPRFGGNVADYKQKINSIDGVGATKVYPVWNGGGTVKCTIIASDWSPPSQALIDHVQTIIDPIPNQGEGLGLAPIDHTVTIAGVTDLTIDVETTLTLESGVTVGQIQGDVEDAIRTYLDGLRKEWAEHDQLIVRIALIDAAILNVQGVLDISDTKLNGVESNITLGSDEVPTLGSVTINEQ